MDSSVFRQAAMNEKKSSEIRRRFRTEKNTITNIQGCYVNQNEEIIILTRAESCKKGNGIVSFAAEDRNTWGKMFNEIHQYFYTGY